LFKVIIATRKRILFEGDAWSVFLPGAEGEFEVMEFHKAILSLLKKGRIVVDWKQSFSIQRGVVRVAEGQLAAAVEE